LLEETSWCVWFLCQLINAGVLANVEQSPAAAAALRYCFVHFLFARNPEAARHWYELDGGR
jgi:hypothetical protein